MFDVARYIGERLPAVIRGVTGVVAAKIATPQEREDPVPHFMEKRLHLLEEYQAALNTKLEEPTPQAVALAEITGAAECPFCKLEEAAGVIRNHLLFIAQECKGDNLGPATGGMVPRVKSLTADFIAGAEVIQASSPVQIIIQLAKYKAEELLPKLEWISSCQEAQEAATMADEMWHRTAKATQIYFAQEEGGPYA